MIVQINSPHAPRVYPDSPEKTAAQMLQRLMDQEGVSFVRFRWEFIYREIDPSTDLHVQVAGARLEQLTDETAIPEVLDTLREIAADINSAIAVIEKHHSTVRQGQHHGPASGSTEAADEHTAAQPGETNLADNDSHG